MGNIPHPSEGLQGVPQNLVDFPLPWSKLSQEGLETLNRCKQSHNSGYAYAIAREMAELTHLGYAKKQVVLEMLGLWTTSPVVRQELEQMVNYAWRNARSRIKYRNPSGAPPVDSLNENAMHVYEALQVIAREATGNIFLPFQTSLSALATRLGQHKTTIHRAVNELLDKKFLIVENPRHRSLKYYKILTEEERGWLLDEQQVREGRAE